jgi:hypothetical protein
MSPRAKQLVAGLAVVAVLVPALSWWERQKRAAASARIKGEAIDRVVEAGGDEAARAYIQDLVEQHHPAAFDEAYGRRRLRPARLDEGKYYDRLLGLMGEQASRDGRLREAVALQVARVTVLGAVLEGGEPLLGE